MPDFANTRVSDSGTPSSAKDVLTYSLLGIGRSAGGAGSGGRVRAIRSLRRQGTGMSRQRDSSQGSYFRNKGGKDMSIPTGKGVIC